MSAPTRTVLWIDDSADERRAGEQILGDIPGLRLLLADSSAPAQKLLDREDVDCVVTDIMRRTASTISVNEGYEFFREYIRPRWPNLPVIFHTKNLPWSFVVDPFSQYLSKWDPIPMKKLEMEGRVCDSVRLYEAFCDHTRWIQVKSRLVEVHSDVLAHLNRYEDIWSMTPDEFEQLVAEVLQRCGCEVLWVPGGRDGGFDIVAACRSTRLLIDVKRYRGHVGVEMVRSIYGVAQAAQLHEEDVLQAGIITSSYFTSEALNFRNSTRPRVTLRDADWLRSQLKEFAPKYSA